ncbi:MAG: thioredoxin family protein [Candidatus Caenarcaniphilales bacterium]|nr:thioredoxin family protein [Candidatus Caenarcaniphilales bacterium]
MFRSKTVILPLVLVLGMVAFGCSNPGKVNKSSDSDSQNEAPKIPQGMQTLPDEAKNAAKEYLGVGQSTAFLFYADWCPVCRSFKPVLEQVEAKHPGVKVVRFNVEEKAEITKSFKVTSIPTLFLFDKEGNFLSSIPGAIPEDQLEQRFGELEKGSS